MIIFLLVVWSGSGVFCCQLGSNLVTKTLPKSTRVGTKYYHKGNQDAHQFFRTFLSILFQSWKAGTPRDFEKPYVV